MKDTAKEVISYVVLAGGRSSRLGHDKAATHVAGVTMLERLTNALPKKPIIVGPEIQGGPAAALFFAITEMESPWVAVVAVDMPFAAPVLALLAELIPNATVDALVPLDSDDRAQWLCGIYRVAALRAAMASLDVIAGTALHKVIAQLRVQEVRISGELRKSLIDVDTASDLARAELFAQQEGSNDVQHG